MPNYRVCETGEIGKLIPCPSDNPIILEFCDKVRDAFHLHEVEPTTLPVSDAPPNVINRRITRPGRPKGIQETTRLVMEAIVDFLLTQSKPVYRRDIENAVGVNCINALMSLPSKTKKVTLESLGIVKRTKGERTWTAWQITEEGRSNGKRIIRSISKDERIRCDALKSCQPTYL